MTYGDGLADRVRAAAPSGITAAIDLIGTDEAVDVSLELVADRQRIATIAAFGRAPGLGIQLLGGGPGADPGDDIRAAARTQLTSAVAAGQLRVFVARTYPLTEAADGPPRHPGRPHDRQDRPAALATGPVGQASHSARLRTNSLSCARLRHSTIGTMAPYSLGPRVAGVPDARAARD